MKEVMAKILIIVITISCIFVFASCDFNNSGNITDETDNTGDEVHAPISPNEVCEAQFNAALNFNNLNNITIKFNSNAPEALTDVTVCFDSNKIEIDYENNIVSDEEFNPDVIYEITDVNPYAYIYFPENIDYTVSGWVRSSVNITDEHLTEAKNSISKLQELSEGLTISDCTYQDGYYTFIKPNYEPLGTDLVIKLRFENSALISIRGEYILDGAPVYELFELSNRGTTSVTIPKKYIDISEISPEPSGDWASYFDFNNVTANLTSEWSYIEYPSLNTTNREQIKRNGDEWILVVDNYYKIYYDGAEIHKENTATDDEQLYLNGSTWFDGLTIFSMYESLFRETSAGIFEAKKISTAADGVSYNDIKILIVDEKIASIDYTMSVNSGEILCEVTYKYKFSNWGTTAVNSIYD